MKCPACDHGNIPGADQCACCGADLSDIGVPQPEAGLLAGFATQHLGDLIPRAPVQVEPDTTVREVIAKLVETGRNCALVVSDGVLKGILTERDILMQVALEYDKLADRPVSEFMTSDPETLGHKDTIAFGLNRMTAGGYRHIPIEQDGKPTGVVSIRDVLGYMVKAHPEQLGPG